MSLSYLTGSLDRTDVDLQMSCKFLVLADPPYYRVLDGFSFKQIYKSTSANEAIQFAIDNLTSGRTWKDTIHVLGDYDVSGQINLDDYLRLIINGKIKLGDNINQNIFYGKDKSYIDIIGGVLDGNKSYNTEEVDVIYLTGCRYVRIEGITIKNAPSSAIQIIGKWVNTTLTVYDTYSAVLNCLIMDGGQSPYVDCHGIRFKFVNYCYALGNTVLGTTRGDGIIGQAVKYAYFNDNLCFNNDYGQIGLDPGQYSEICNNVVGSSSMYDGIQVHSQSSNDVLVEDNVSIGSVNNGLWLLEPKRVTVKGNIFANNNWHGIRISGETENCLIVDNYIVDNSQGGDNLYDGIILEAWDTRTPAQNEIRGNYIISTGTTRHRYGINEEAGDFNRIWLNRIENPGTQAILKTGSNSSIKFNEGYRTENSGVSSFISDGTVTAFTISHGLVGEPTAVQISPYTSEAAGDYFITKDSINFIVNYLTAPVAGTVEFGWEVTI